MVFLFVQLIEDNEGSKDVPTDSVERQEVAMPKGLEQQEYVDVTQKCPITLSIQNFHSSDSYSCSCSLQLNTFKL